MQPWDGARRCPQRGSDDAANSHFRSQTAHLSLNNIPRDSFTAEQQKALNSLRASRVILPILIGFGVVGWLFYRQFDMSEWSAIDWTWTTIFWIGMSLTLLIVRHLAYATRLYVVSEGDFSFRKCIELSFIWEFSSAVSPTSMGGSAVALFVLSQERISAGRTASIVLYTVVLDTAFFVVLLPILFAIFGPTMIRPDVDSLLQLRGWGLTFLLAYLGMLVYGIFLTWGLFFSPWAMRSVLSWLAKRRILKRFRENIVNTGRDLVAASIHIRQKPWRWHAMAFGSTSVAWSFRFLLLSCLFIAFTDISTDLLTQTKLFARLEAMFVIIAFSPTPGGAGFVETLFKDFLNDFVDGNRTSALVIATIWRAFTYYAYLFAGVIIIPNWLRGIMRRRAERNALHSGFSAKTGKAGLGQERQPTAV